MPVDRGNGKVEWGKWGRHNAIEEEKAFLSQAGRVKQQFKKVNGDRYNPEFVTLALSTRCHSIKVTKAVLISGLFIVIDQSLDSFNLEAAVMFMVELQYH